VSIEIHFLARRLPCTLPRLWIFLRAFAGARWLVGSPWEAGGPSSRLPPSRPTTAGAAPFTRSVASPVFPSVAAPLSGTCAGGPVAGLARTTRTNASPRTAPHRTAPHHHRGTTAPVSSLLVLCVPSPPRPPLVPRPPRCSLPLPPPSARPRARVWTPSSPAFPPVSLTWHRIACILRLPVLPFPACTFLDPALQSPASKRLVAA